MLMSKSVIPGNKTCSQPFIITSSPVDKLISRNNGGEREIKTFIIKKNNAFIKLPVYYPQLLAFFIFSFRELPIIFKNLLLRAKC